MNKNEKRERLQAIINQDKVIGDIFSAKVSLEEKRVELRNYLSNILLSVFDEDRHIPPMEWVLCRDAVWVMRNILAPRSEDLAGFSVLEYIDTQLREPDKKGLAPLSRDFLAEMDYLFKGMQGRSCIYKDKAPAFLKHSGRKAAKLRSKDLSRMAKKADRFMQRYPSGLDPELIKTRSALKQKIQHYYGISDLEWGDWKWHTKHIIRDSDAVSSMVRLSENAQKAISMARENRIPFGVTPYYLSLMDPDDTGEWDRAIRAQVFPPEDYVTKMVEHRSCGACSMDFMIENDTSPVDGITRRYPNIVILKPILTCPQICVYCQRNWQIEDVFSENAAIGQKKLERAMQWIEETPEINEVLITGGDPLLLSDEKLGAILQRLSEIAHVIRIRIGTRTPVTLPQRITDALVRGITRFHVPGQREIIVITHFEHSTEVTPEAMEAVQKFRRFGVEVYNQLVFTYYNSRKFETSVLRQKLRLIGVTPYYTFNTKGKEETDQYRVPIARLLQEQKEEARLLPGTVRTDEIVFNVPRLGKNYLRAAQHRDVISILPDGRRVYEFHPWEKKLALMDTYVYTDVSIYQYLKRLRRDAENLKDYETIWYYY